jgi:uncharacterized protein
MPSVLTLPPTALVRCNVRSEFNARAEGEQLVIEGYAALYDSPTMIGGWYEEVMRNGAFADALAGMDDVRCLWQHDANFPLGRNTAGTLKLSSDSKGLIYECRLGASQWARDAHEAIKRGDVSQSSFGFTPIQDNWIWAKDDKTPDRCERVKVKLWDVSPVTYPAYEDTEVSARDRRCHEVAARSVKALAEMQDRDARLRRISLELAGDTLR